MEREKVQRYVASLEQVIRNAHLDLKETMTQFQGFSQRVTSEDTVPSGIITDIRRTYKGIQDQLTKIRGVHQLLESRYKQYYRRDSLREKEIAEFAFLARNMYARFESVLQETEAKKKSRDTGEASDLSKPSVSFPWFHSEENQVVLLRNLQDLYALDYGNGKGLEVDGKRRVIQDKLRSLSLFILSGEGGVIDTLQSRIRLRKHDIKERYATDELRGVLTHLKEISLIEAAMVIKRFVDSREAAKLKCLLFSIRSQEDLRKEIIGSANNILTGMASGEVRAFPI